jgi:hypothetical protein
MNTSQACWLAGVDATPAAPEAAGADALIKECVGAGGAERRCEAIRDTAEADFLDRLSPDMLTCIHNSGIPKRCVEEEDF